MNVQLKSPASRLSHIRGKLAVGVIFFLIKLELRIYLIDSLLFDLRMAVAGIWSIWTFPFLRAWWKSKNVENAMLYAWEIKAIYALFGKENILHTPRKVPHMEILMTNCNIMCGTQ